MADILLFCGIRRDHIERESAIAEGGRVETGSIDRDFDAWGTSASGFRSTRRPRRRELHDRRRRRPLRPKLEECPDCGAIGLPERIENHDCEEFFERRDSQ